MTPSLANDLSGEDFVRDVKNRIKQVSLDVERAIEENRCPRFMHVLFKTDAFLIKCVAALSRTLT